MRKRLAAVVLLAGGCQSDSAENQDVSADEPCTSQEELLEAHAVELIEDDLTMAVTDSYEDFANENDYAFDDYWPPIVSSLNGAAISKEDGERLTMEEFEKILEESGEERITILTDLDIEAFFFRNVSEEPLKEDESGSVKMDVCTIIVKDEEEA